MMALHLWCLLLTCFSSLIIADSIEIEEREFEEQATKVLESVSKRDSSKKSTGYLDLASGERKTDWDANYKEMNTKLNEKDWELKGDHIEDHYPNDLKKKIENGEKISASDSAKIENEYGRFKSRPWTTVFDLVMIINRGNDLSLDEADIKRKAPNFDYRKYVNEFFEKENERERKKSKKKGKVTLEDMLGKKSIIEDEKFLLNDNDAWEKRKRDARRDRVYLWQDRMVPFEVSPELVDSISLIESAMSEIQSKTCIKFVHKTSNHDNWVRFVKKPGCWSSIGKEFWRPGFQEISLGPNCLYKGIIIHEVMHALGFFHEQSRPDRDQYIEIFWDNIEPDKKPTILSIKDKNVFYGQRNELSKTDIFQINELYDCQYEAHGWSRWSSFSPCDKDCYKERARYCRERKNGQITCQQPKSIVLVRWGVDLEKVRCTAAECYAPLDGNWNKWGAWNECSTTCDKGKQTRIRQCDDPRPKNGGKNCEGVSTKTRECLIRSCKAGMYDCAFDSDQDPFCSWRKDIAGDFQWIRHIGNTPSQSTGPSADHTSGAGHYLFIESSGPARKGWKARLISPSMPSKQRCMAFSYSMYGLTTGYLRVYIDDYKTEKQSIIFEKKGNQFNEWFTHKIQLNPTSLSRIIIEAERGNGFQGDIAIDDIIIQDGSCSGENVKTTTKPVIRTVKRVGCYHDYGFVDGKKPFPRTKSFRKGIIWSDYMDSLQNIVLKCSAFARKHGYEYFAIQYWGECWTGLTTDINYGRDGESTGCFPPQQDNRGPYLVGMEFTNMVYRWE